MGGGETGFLLPGDVVQTSEDQKGEEAQVKGLAKA